jgi:hypothetical protein
MPASEKILWIVNYDAVAHVLGAAQAAGATGVALRTDNDIAAALPVLHAHGIKVFGWRWPSARVDPAMKEADKVVALLALGMDGYYVDPEGAEKVNGKPTKPYDWDQPGLAPVAQAFCQRIAGALGGRPFGFTSHYRAKAVFPNLPWTTFFQYATVLLPQSYWRSTEGTIGHGLPEDNYRRGLEFWAKAGGAKNLIVPMAGELGSVTAAEIGRYVAEAKAQGVDSLHFYTWDSSVKPTVMAAIAAA